MANSYEFLIQKIYHKASYSRIFEESLYNKVIEKTVKIPVYLSAGQEYISATLGTYYDYLMPMDRQIFIQHRGHSTYLSFGGNLENLINELLGNKTKSTNGMAGSASIHSIESNIFGHDGLMGSHGPISVGMCYANNKPTFCFIGDAAAEEDYFIAALGWASTKNLPIIFIVEDNNYSILTEKIVRRNWNIDEVAKGFKIESYNIIDDPKEIIKVLHKKINSPMLLNINTTRLFWHSGAGINNENEFDRHKLIKLELGKDITEKIDSFNLKLITDAWQKCLNN